MKTEAKDSEQRLETCSFQTCWHCPLAFICYKDEEFRNEINKL